MKLKVTCLLLLLTHTNLASFLWDKSKQYSPMMQSMASHLGLFCLHRDISSKNEIKIIILDKLQRITSNMVLLFIYTTFQPHKN